MFTIIEDKDLIWEVEDYQTILVGTSIYCYLSDGFSRKMAKRFPILYYENNRTKYKDSRKLGNIINVEVSENLECTLCYISNRTMNAHVTVHYDSLIECMKKANFLHKGKKVATTVMGTFIWDGRGEKDKVLRILEEYSKDIDLTVYDYRQLTNDEEITRYFRYIYSLKKKNYDLFKELSKRRYEDLKDLYLA